MPDPITHISVSYIFARHWFRKHTLLFVIAALSPDIDVVVGGIFILLTGPLPKSLGEFANKSMIFHPTLSAAIWFIPIYCVLLAWGFRRFSKKAAIAGFRRTYIAALAGAFFHIGLDLLQSGNRPLWPLEMTLGLNILPYSLGGRVWTMIMAIGILIVDSVVVFGFRRSH
jgi:hypothetical protein